MKYLLAVIVHLCFTVSLYSQAVYKPAEFADKDRLQKVSETFPVMDKLMKAQAERAHYPGMAYGFIVDGKLVHTGYLGYSDIDKKIPVNSKSAFRIASMTKSFTCMAVVKLRDEGKIVFDDPAYKYIPQLKRLKYLTSDARPITVRDLLTHAAGFPEDNPWGDRQLDDTEEALTKLIEGGLTFSNNPGVEFEYANLGFALLGRIITNVSKKPYHQYITDNIFKPLEMNNTYWEYNEVTASQLALGYRWINGNWRTEPLLHHGSHAAMGGIITTIEDLAKYVAFHQSAWPTRNEPDNGPIKKSSLREMHRPWNFVGMNIHYTYPGGRVCPVTEAYGYGLSWMKDCNDRVIIGHGGGLPGFGSHWRFLPDYGIGIISFANVTYAGTSRVNLRVLDTVINLAELKPRVLPVSSILDQRKDQLLSMLPEWHGAEASGIFAENFFPDFIIDSLKKQSAAAFKTAGKITGKPVMMPENQLRGTVTLRGENADINVYFTLTPENPPLIQDFEIWTVKKSK